MSWGLDDYFPPLHSVVSFPLFIYFSIVFNSFPLLIFLPCKIIWIGGEKQDWFKPKGTKNVHKILFLCQEF